MFSVKLQKLKIITDETKTLVSVTTKQTKRGENHSPFSIEG
jgi:hypothetical protein